MKNKLYYVVAGSLLVFSLGIFSLVGAENDNKQGDEDGMRNFKAAHSTGSTLEVHIFDDGKVLVRGAEVTGVSGNVISAHTKWGSVNMDWAVNADTGSKFVRKFGGVSSISEVAIGDFISFHGSLVSTTSSPLTVNADVVKDWSIQKKEANWNGTVKSVDTGAMSFVLDPEDGADVTVLVTSSTSIKKGEDAGVFADITVGAKVSARGVWDTVSGKLTATKIKIASASSSDGKEKEKTVTGGVIKSIGSTTSFIMTSGDKDYTVKINSETSVLNNLWLGVNFSTFKVGDKVQAYGAINSDMSIDATVVRDLGPKKSE